MAIELYDKAEVIERGEMVYYFLKSGSKNDFICSGQTIVGPDFMPKFITRQVRSSCWRLVAYGTLQDHKSGRIGYTKYNCPTSYMYGQIKFGDRLNIALWFAKRKPKLYHNYSPTQQEKIDWIINNFKESAINLSSMSTKDVQQTFHEYCGKTYIIGPNKTEYNNHYYWQLNNL